MFFVNKFARRNSLSLFLLQTYLKITRPLFLSSYFPFENYRNALNVFEKRDFFLEHLTFFLEGRGQSFRLKKNTRKKWIFIGCFFFLIMPKISLNVFCNEFFQNPYPQRWTYWVDRILPQFCTASAIEHETYALKQMQYRFAVIYETPSCKKICLCFQTARCRWHLENVEFNVLFILIF